MPCSCASARAFEYTVHERSGRREEPSAGGSRLNRAVRRNDREPGGKYDAGPERLRYPRFGDHAESALPEAPRLHANDGARGGGYCGRGNVIDWPYVEGLRITFTKRRPRNTWAALQPKEYGFYANVNPVESVLHRNGIWTLRFLILTLALTPLRRITGWNELTRFRRMLGLFAFFYGTLHLLTYVLLDQSLHLPTLLKDVAKRPYITVGFASFLLMIPLAVTSTRKWIARLGRRWRLLHRLVYVSASGGILHFLWQVKADNRQPLMYGAIVALLLGYRFVYRLRSRAAVRVPTAAS